MKRRPSFAGDLANANNRAEQRIQTTYEEDFASRFEALAKRHGLNEERWTPGDGPLEYEALNAEFDVKGGAKLRRVAGRSKSAAPLEELCGSWRIASIALWAIGRPNWPTEDRECTRTWTSG